MNKQKSQSGYINYDGMRKFLNTRFEVDQRQKISFLSAVFLIAATITCLLCGIPFYIPIAILILLLAVNFWARTGFWKFILIIVLIILFCYGYGFVKDKVIITNETPEIEKYLESKYDQEFVLNKIKVGELNSKCFGFKGVGQEGIMAEVYPTDNESLKFIVYKCFEREPYSYKDDYATTTWEYQERIKIKKFLATVFDTVPDFELMISVIYPFDLAAHINGTPPDFATFSAQYKSDIRYHLELTLDDENFYKNKTTHQAKAYKILEYLRSTGFGEAQISYNVNIRSQDIRYSCVKGDHWGSRGYEEHNAENPSDMDFHEVDIFPASDLFD